MDHRSIVTSSVQKRAGLYGISSAQPGFPPISDSSLRGTDSTDPRRNQTFPYAHQVSTSITPFGSSSSATAAHIQPSQRQLTAENVQPQELNSGAINSQRKSEGSAPRRSKYSSSDWESYRPHIKRYYFDEDKTLEDTRVIMAREHAFNPSIKMYKEKFKEWGWSKYLPKATAEWMSNKARQRKSHPGGKDTVFHFGNQTWTVDRVQKSVRRTKAQENEVVILDVPTPSDITYATPQNVNHSPSHVHSPRTSGFSPGRWTPAPNLSSTPVLQGHLRLTWNGHTRADIEAMNREAYQLERLGHIEEAEKMFREVLTGFENLVSPTHEDTSAAAYKLATFYAQQNRMTEADLVLDRMGEKYTERWGLKHKETLMHFLRVVELFNCWSRTDDAVTLLYRVLDIYGRHYFEGATNVTELNPPATGSQPQVPRVRGAVRPSRVDISIGAFTQTNDPTLVHYQLGLVNIHVKAKNEEAEPLLLRLIEQCEVYPERLAQEILQARCALVDLYQQLENDERIIVAVQQAQKALWTILNSNTEKTKPLLETCTNVARLHVQAGHYDAAEDICQRIATEAERKFGTDNGFTIGVFIRIGKFYQGENRWTDAQPWFERALAASIAANGLSSALTLRLEAALARKHYHVPLSKIEDFADLVRSRYLSD